MSPQIEVDVLNSVSNLLTPYLAQFKFFRIYDFDNQIEVKGQVNEDDFAETLIIKIIFNHNEKQVYIPNIFMPDFMRHKGIGKELINLTYKSSKAHAYDVYIVDLTHGFYERLVKRGAEIIDEENIVMITERTTLK